jgi:MarR family transcriptional regulator, organic hydroperoxide resistance regulator
MLLNVNVFLRGSTNMDKTPDELADIIDNLRRVFQVVNEHSKKAEKTTGITGPQLWAIKTIAEKAPIRVSDLAHSMHLNPATVVGILDRLEARGLVHRTRSTEDRRVVTIDLSDQGKELVRRAPEVAQGLLVAGLENLSSEKRKVIAQGLAHLVDILGVQKIPPKLIRSPEFNKL